MSDVKKPSLGERLMIQSNEKAGDYIIKTATQDISVCSYAMKVTTELTKLFGTNFAENKERAIDWSRYNYDACKLIIMHIYEILDLDEYNKLAPIEVYFHDAVTLAEMYGLSELAQNLLDFMVEYCDNTFDAEFKFYENVKRDKMNLSFYNQIVARIFKNIIVECKSYKEIMENRTDLLFDLMEAKNDAAITLISSQIKLLNSLTASDLIVFSRPKDDKTMTVASYPNKEEQVLVKKLCDLDADFKKQVTVKDDIYTISSIDSSPNILSINKPTFFAKKTGVSINGRDGVLFHTIAVYYLDNE